MVLQWEDKKMRNFLLIFCLLVASLATQGQNSTSASGDFQIGYSQTFSIFPQPGSGLIAPIFSGPDSVWTYTLLKEDVKALKYNILLSLDSVGGTKQATTVVLKYKVWPEQASYTTLTTVVWRNGHDTIIDFSETSTAVHARLWQISVSAARKGFKVNCKLLEHKFFQ
jgi:hypothetical protein